MAVSDLNAQRAVSELRDLLGDRCSTSAYDIESHAHDESFHPPAPPDAVAFPESNEEVAAVIGICRKLRVPVIPFGAGTAVAEPFGPTRNESCFGETSHAAMLL